MEQWDKLVKDLLSDHSPKELKESLRTFYDSYVTVADGGINLEKHHRYRTLEKFLEKIEKKEKVAHLPPN